jgi:tetratricopeptide (TPR) repeat protein
MGHAENIPDRTLSFCRERIAVHLDSIWKRDDRMSSSSTDCRAGRLRQNALLVCIFGAMFLPFTGDSLASQSDPEAIFNQAVDSYRQNQFTAALQKFQQVSGPHAQEAQQYIQKMKVYREAIDVAKSEIDRSPNELDADSLDYAIQRLEQAIQIKPDGPWDPNGLLARARDLRTQVEKKNGERGKSLDIDFCAKSVAAAEQHHYAEAAHFICTVANDNPGYQCGGDDAVHLCQVDNELAKIDKNASAQTSARSENTPPRPDRDTTYTDAIAAGEKFAHDGLYEQARASFLRAASIKSDGPGAPQNQASIMELFLGLDRFYSGDYASAIQALKDCSQSAALKQPLVHFYLGASELARFLVSGSEDDALHQNALNDLKMAKQAGFKATEDISPKILRVYNDL